MNKARLSLAALAALFFTAAAAQPADTLELSLADAIRLALRESPAAVQASATKTSGVTALASGVNSILPSVSGSLSYGRDDAAPDSVATSWTAGLTVNQVVFNPSVFAGLVSSAVRFSHNSASARDQQARLIYDVTADYLGLLKTAWLTEVAQAALARSEKQLELVREKHRLGMVSSIDLLRAEVQEFQSRLSLLEVEQNHVASAENFKATAGLGRATFVVPTESLDAPMEFPVSDPDSLIAGIERTNPGVILAHQSRIIADANQVAAWTSVLPSVNLYWNKSYSGDALPSGFGQWQDEAKTSYGLRASLPLLDLKSYVINVADAANSSRRARASARAAELQIRAAAADAVLGYRLARNQYDLSLVNLELARKLRELADEQMRLGAITMVDYLDVDAGLVQAQSSYISALSNTYVRAAQISYLAGRN